MSQDVNYERPKLVPTNTTPMAMHAEGAEVGGTEVALAAGSSAGIQATIIADADESGGADLQDLYKITAVPVINSVTGEQLLRVTVTPVLGDATDGVPVTTDYPHSEAMDVWQVAAGRPRQV